MYLRPMLLALLLMMVMMAMPLVMLIRLRGDEHSLDHFGVQEAGSSGAIFINEPCLTGQGPRDLRLNARQPGS